MVAVHTTFLVPMHTAACNRGQLGEYGVILVVLMCMKRESDCDNDIYAREDLFGCEYLERVVVYIWILWRARRVQRHLGPAFFRRWNPFRYGGSDPVA